MHYLDVVLLAGTANPPDCASLLQHFVDMTVQLGVPLAGDKTESPTTALSFLSFELDVISAVSRFPHEKEQQVQDMIATPLGKSKATFKEFQLVLGHLNFACRVVVPSRAFC